LEQTTNNPTVYIVDDDRAIRESMTAVIESMGFQSQGFSSAEDFLARADTTRRGCLVLDVRMPGMSGFELQERLADDGVMLPIIFYSGHGDISRLNDKLPPGVVAYLEKPSPPDTLAAAIH
jgi:FixJ family two-component response regulator